MLFLCGSILTTNVVIGSQVCDTKHEFSLIHSTLLIRANPTVQRQLVLQNGTARIELNFTNSSYIGQLNLNYTYLNGNSGLYRSSFFNVEYDAAEIASTYSLASASTASTAVSSRSTTSTLSTASTTVSYHPTISAPTEPLRSSSNIIAKTSSTFCSQTKEPSCQHHGLSKAAEAGIGVGVAFAALTLIAMIFAMRTWKKRDRRQQDSQVDPQKRTSSAPLPKVFGSKSKARDTTLTKTINTSSLDAVLRIVVLVSWKLSLAERMASRIVNTTVRPRVHSSCPRTR